MIINDRANDLAGPTIVPRSWAEWWLSLQPAISAGINPATFTPPILLADSSNQRPAYTLPPYPQMPTQALNQTA